MRFLRHDGIYRSDVSLLLINPVQLPPPVGRPRYRAIGRAGRNYTSCPSSAMSSGRLFLDRGGRHQSPSPLHRHPQHNPLAFRRASIYHRTAGSVLTVCVSRGDKRKLYSLLPCKAKKQVSPYWFAQRKAWVREHVLSFSGITRLGPRSIGETQETTMQPDEQVGECANLLRRRRALSLRVH
jgi:hypothetical protein